jgi:hypothetical protein
LGLAIAKSIVEEYKGRISTDSKVGQGTSISVLLPIAQPNTGQHIAPVARMSPSVPVRNYVPAGAIGKEKARGLDPLALSIRWQGRRYVGDNATLSVWWLD